MIRDQIQSIFLNFLLISYCKYWKGISLLQGLKSSILDLVVSAHPMQDRECFRVTLEKWLQLNVGVTWANLELALILMQIVRVWASNH